MGTPLNTLSSVMDRVDIGPGCWEWTRGTNGVGYGRVSWGGRYEYVHRILYQHFVGPIPDGLELDHLCRNRLCANPEHLEAVTSTENKRRGIAGKLAGARQRAKTHCPSGHPYSGENLYECRGERICRECNRAAARRYQARKRKQAR